ncbi:MAG TPA: hypothetical protein VGD58_17260 [Herpetosiphonaceae bacterium]
MEYVLFQAWMLVLFGAYALDMLPSQDGTKIGRMLLNDRACSAEHHSGRAIDTGYNRHSAGFDESLIDEEHHATIL